MESGSRCTRDRLIPRQSSVSTFALPVRVIKRAAESRRVYLATAPVLPWVLIGVVVLCGPLRAAEPRPPQAPSGNAYPLVRISTGAISVPDLGITARHLNAEVQPGQDGWQARYSVTDIRKPDWPPAAAAASVEGSLRYRADSIQASGHVSLVGQPVARWELHPTARPASLTVYVDAPAATLWQALYAHLDDSFHALEIAAGAVRGRLLFDVTSDTPLDGTGTLTVHSMTGTYEELEFSETDITAEIARLMHPELDYRIEIGAFTLANGLTGTRLQTRAHHEGDRLHFEGLRLHALGGVIAIPTASVDVNRYPYEIVLHVRDAELAAILALAGQESLSGSGTLTGTIPLTVHADYFVIEDAELHNDVSGNLSYKPMSANVAQTMDNIALRALEDFRYDVLNVRLDYDREGDYAIKARLEGHNPDLYDGHPIAFNLNITGTLPGLIRSSLISGDFTGEILRSINTDMTNEPR